MNKLNSDLNLFNQLARDLDNDITSQTGKTLNIVEFIEQEVDLGIELTTNQSLILKIIYNCPLTDEEISILEYWKAVGKTTWTEPRESEPQIAVIESGRRCLVGSTRISTPDGFITFNELAKKYTAQLAITGEANIDLSIIRPNLEVVKAKKLFRYKTKELCTVITKETHLEGTPEHKLYVVDKDYLPMNKIRVGDTLKYYDATYNAERLTTVIDIRCDILDESVYVYDIEVPEDHYYVANNIISSNSGKSSLAALVAAYEFYFMSKLHSPQKHFKVATSTPIAILCLATTADQAKENIFLQVAQILKNSQYFIDLIQAKKVFVGKESISYEEKGIYIRCGNSKSSSQVGGTLKCFILDEVARFQDIKGNSNALELWSNIGISTAPFGNKAKLIAISSAWEEGDAIQKLYEKSQINPNAVGFRLVSWDLNTTINKDNPIVASEYIDDPTRAALEYEGIRPLAADAYFNAEQVNAAFTGDTKIKATRYTEQSKTLPDLNLVKLTIDHIAPRQHYSNALHIDPAVKGDAYAMAFGHSDFNEDNEMLVVIDGLLAWKTNKPNEEISISDVGKAIRTVNAHRPLCIATADHYNSAETIQRLRQDGIPAEVVFFSNRQQLLMYSCVKTLLAENRLILPKDSQWTELLKREMTRVKLINGKKIDHDSKSSKDLVDAIVSVAYYLSEKVVTHSATHISRARENPTIQDSKSYREMSYVEKAKYKAAERNLWWREALNNSKFTKKIN